MPGSPLSNKQHLTKHIWRGKTQTASLKPISWLGCKRKRWASQGCNDGGEERNTHNLMSQWQQSVTFVCNAKGGKSPIRWAQQRTQFALLLGSISRKLLPLTFLAALHATSLCTQVLTLGDVSCKWGWPTSPSMRRAAPPLEWPTREALKEGETLPTEHRQMPSLPCLCPGTRDWTFLIWAWNCRAFINICLSKKKKGGKKKKKREKNLKKEKKSCF